MSSGVEVRPPLTAKSPGSSSGSHTHMRLSDGIEIALSSLRANRLRAFLTLLGIIIGIASIISVVSIIEGLNSYWREKVADLGANVFMVNQFGVPTSRQAFLDAVKRNREITLEDYETIRAHAPAVQNIGLRVSRTRELRYGNQKLLEARVVGMTANMLSIQKVNIEHGRFFTSQEEERGVPLAFIGTDVRDQLFANVDPLEKTIKVGGRDFRVIGIAERQGSVFGASQDNFAYIPLTVFQKMYGIRSNLSIYVQAEGDRNMEEAIDQTRVALRAGRRAVREGGTRVAVTG